MEVQTKDPQTKTTLRIQGDRTFDRQSGDSVLRVQGQGEDGSQVFDAAYVEVNEQEAQALGKLLRQLRSPSSEMTDQIAQEILSAYGSKLGGAQAHQIAELVVRAQRWQIAQQFGTDESQQAQAIERLAERFERTAANRRTPSGGAPGNGQSS